MKKRLGNFFLLSGLINLVIFFSSSSSGLDQIYFLLGGICLCSLGFLFRKASRPKRDKRGWFGKRSREKSMGELDLDHEND
ncbi:MAG: hypothetical protein MUO54_03405 [Anaerolineales bacterium]|nr:hypothetical protein [Anaerolineales bacterium]